MRAKLLAAFDLFEAGVDLMRQRLRRQYPDETDREIERRIGAWLRERPGAEHGDGVGRVVSWPRRSQG
jgi:Rv0078B-related antitoxin